MLRIGVLASHQGTNFQTIADACASKKISAEVKLLICNNSNAPVMARAINANIPAIHLSTKTHPSGLDDAIHTALTKAEVELIVLAGYMKKLGHKVINQYLDHIINVHPSLLPKHGGQGFYGARVHQAVLDAGDRETGASVHLVNGEYDQGRVLAQTSIPVAPQDTSESLATKVHELEYELLLKVIQQFATGELP